MIATGTRAVITAQGAVRMSPGLPRRTANIHHFPNVLQDNFNEDLFSGANTNFSMTVCLERGSYKPARHQQQTNHHRVTGVRSTLAIARTSLPSRKGRTRRALGGHLQCKPRDLAVPHFRRGLTGKRLLTTELRAQDDRGTRWTQHTATVQAGSPSVSWLHGRRHRLSSPALPTAQSEAEVKHCPRASKQKWAHTGLLCSST